MIRRKKRVGRKNRFILLIIIPIIVISSGYYLYRKSLTWEPNLRIDIVEQELFYKCVEPHKHFLSSVTSYNPSINSSIFIFRSSYSDSNIIASQMFNLTICAADYKYHWRIRKTNPYIVVIASDRDEQWNLTSRVRLEEAKEYLNNNHPFSEWLDKVEKSS